MALKKSQLYRSLWQSCDELRGGMDASQYKDYVLTLLFMKYVTDKFADKPDALIEVPEGGGFTDMSKLKGDKNIGEEINKVIARFADANDLKGVIDQADFNDGSKLGDPKEMQDRLSKLVAIFDGLDFRANRAEGDDLLGDAYEYLMRHFATESGKSKGQFYTPAEVSTIMARVVGIGHDTQPSDTVYDPTCGSGSLLIKAAEQAPHGITIYGQEMDVATWALARMNMILHGHPTAELWRQNTLAAPHFKDKTGKLRTFDFAVANPPFSQKAWTNGFDPANDEFDRFDYGIPPAKNGDYAFLLHLNKSLKSNGKGAIILPHGVLFRGKKEADIRRNLIQRGVIKGIIGLPANLFYGTGIPACILVVDKAHAHARTGVFMVDASKGFLKDGNKNRLRAQDIHKIVDVFTRQLELPRYSRMVPVTEIGDPSNDFNLNLARYIDSSEPEDLQDLDAHLNGGIPVRDIDALEAYWEVCPTLRDELFMVGSRPGYLEPRVPPAQLRETIVEHPEFQAFENQMRGVFDGWCNAHRATLQDFKVDDRPSELIDALSEDLLVRFSHLPLISSYSVYQRLMDYWAEVMQDDAYLIAADGWMDAARPRGVVADKERNIKETPDLTIKHKKYKMDLVSPALVASAFFAEEQTAVEALQAKQEVADRELEDFVEEHSGEGGLLSDATSDAGKVTKGGVKARLKALEDEPSVADAEADDDDESEALARCLTLIDAQLAAAKAAKEAQCALDDKVLGRYTKLTEADIKSIVVEDKWLASLRASIDGEVQRVTQELADRVRELEARYAQALPELEVEVDALGAKVEEHLKMMGLAWG